MLTHLSKTDTRLINILFLTSILVFINIGPVSVSFPIGLMVLVYFSRRIHFKLFRKPVLWLTLLVLTGYISSILSDIPFVNNLYFLIQLFYWLLLTCTIGQLYPYIDKKMLGKTIVVGTIILGTVNFLLGWGTQNSVAFTLVIFTPLGLYGIGKKALTFLYAFLMLFFMFFNESRSGFFILTFEMLFLFFQYFQLRKMKIIIVSIVSVFVLFFFTPLNTIIGKFIEPYNPEVAALLIDSDAVFSTDKSWIQRKIQVQKGLQLFEEHPIIGIGPNNFSKTYVDIDITNIQNVDEATLIETLKKADYRSTHNSYITLLSEFGAVGLAFFILFLIPFLIKSFQNINYKGESDFLLVVAVVGMCLYFYTIAAFYGTAAWLFYGLIYGYTNSYRKSKR